MKYSTLALLFCFLVFSHWAFAQKINFPDAGAAWQEQSASSLDMDETIVREAVAFAEANEYKESKDLRQAILKGFQHEPYHKILGPTKRRGGPAGMILKNGFVVASWGDTKRVDMTFSVTKSFLSTTAAIALQDGLIGSVDDTVAQYVWDGTFDGKHNSAITWKHLLQQNSDWSGELWGGKDWADRPPREGDIDDWKNRELRAPGSVFEYNDVRVNVLAYSLTNVLRKPLPQVLKERVMNPIGASTTWRWYGYDNSWFTLDGLQVQSVSGGGHSGGGMFISTEDMARFGLLFMNGGKWKENQVIAPQWIDELRQSSTPNPNYGYMWWLNADGPRQWEGVPQHVYYAAGFGGNFIIVDDQEKMVIVVRWLEPSQIGEFVKKVYTAL
ncbi:MAG: serine hydrolase [Cytophagaceae bacterium]|nr:serine hydrolase [Cytophagaceae bacterium]|tara:strand:- start:22486 stop:23640 length:1155 start_codon:yes stop_codon:yes gene_type:complete